MKQWRAHVSSRVRDGDGRVTEFSMHFDVAAPNRFQARADALIMVQRRMIPEFFTVMFNNAEGTRWNVDVDLLT